MSRTWRDEIKDAKAAVKTLVDFCTRRMIIDEDGDFECECPFIMYSGGGWTYCGLTNGDDEDSTPVGWTELVKKRGANK